MFLLVSFLNSNIASKETKLDPEKQILDEKSKLNYVSTVSSVKKQTEAVVAEKNTGKVAGASVAGGKVYLGFAFESRSVARVNQVQGQIGRAFPLYMTYLQWGNPQNSTINSAFFSVFNSTGTIPIISWEPWSPFNGVNQPDYKLSNIANGNFDSYVKNSALAIKAYNKPVFLRFAHEMNGNWYPWGGTVNGNSASDYITAYRHVHDIFAQNGVGNVTWIWCPDTWSFPQFNGNNISDYYPGSGYVDWVGLDGYNFGNSKAGQKWKSFTELFSPGYKQVSGYNKPIMIAETASSESGGNKASWIASTFDREIPQNFPRIKAVIWFDINKETDWDLASSPTSMSQFKNSVANDIYKPTPVISNAKIISP
ncbi:MAG TPA: glycosyl hydrolase [Candidatus Saccharimonadales bacterium]|nr:glycosyl hydrolase [Candidatus Saccharimonadales bacterium]